MFRKFSSLFFQDFIKYLFRKILFRNKLYVTTQSQSSSAISKRVGVFYIFRLHHKYKRDNRNSLKYAFTNMNTYVYILYSEFRHRTYFPLNVPNGINIPQRNKEEKFANIQLSYCLFTIFGLFSPHSLCAFSKRKINRAHYA